MKKILVALRIDQIDFLRTLPGKITEHVRRAVDDYIEKKKNTNAETSLSKKGGNNGQ